MQASRFLPFFLLFTTLNLSACGENDDIASSALLSTTDLTPYNAFLDRFEAFYGPLATSHGGELVVHRRLDDTRVDASAQRFRGGPWELSFHGGLIHEERLTFDAFQLIVCHEAGHHFGGFPLRSDWGANEGQADYFATQSCAREMWRGEIEANAAARASVDPYAKSACDRAWSIENEQNLCYRSMSAALTLMRFLGYGEDIRFDKPSRDSVAKTKKYYPTNQCRLDTMVAGALCNKTFNPTVIPQTQAEAAENSCLDAVPSIGDRPICWFARVEE